jgi:lipid-A-disaccharide synthase
VKYFLIAGENSGDLHGAEIIKKIFLNDAHPQFEFWGGDEMQKASNCVAKKHISSLAFMGFTQVATHFLDILANFRLAKKQILDFKPDKIIFIDYPGFNLRLCRWAKTVGFKTYYYISPTVWAWHKSRIKIIRSYVDVMMVIFPFEKQWYKNEGIDVHYVGNSRYEEIKKQMLNEKFRSKYNLEKPIIALVPGSRKQEFNMILPIMLKATEAFCRDYDIVVAGLSQHKSLYNICSPYQCKIIYDDLPQLLLYSHAAAVTSGTASLEAAFFNVPQVVCYKTNLINYSIAKLLVNLPYISLPNILSGRHLVKELIQNELTVDALKKEIEKILTLSSAEKSELYLTLLNSFEKIESEDLGLVICQS